MNVVQTRRQRKDEVCPRKDILGVAAIHCVARKSRLIAEIFHSVMAVPAITIYTAHPRNSNTGSERQLRSRALDDFSHDLMTRNELRSKRWEIPFNDVQ